MNIREFFANWDNSFPALSRIAIKVGTLQGTVKQMIDSFGNLEITNVKEEIVGDSYTGRMKVFILTINGEDIRVF